MLTISIKGVYLISQFAVHVYVYLATKYPRTQRTLQLGCKLSLYLSNKRPEELHFCIRGNVRTYVGGLVSAHVIARLIERRVRRVIRSVCRSFAAMKGRWRSYKHRFTPWLALNWSTR